MKSILTIVLGFVLLAFVGSAFAEDKPLSNPFEGTDWAAVNRGDNPDGTKSNSSLWHLIQIVLLMIVCLGGGGIMKTVTTTLINPDGGISGSAVSSYSDGSGSALGAIGTLICMAIVGSVYYWFVYHVCGMQW